MSPNTNYGCSPNQNNWIVIILYIILMHRSSPPWKFFVLLVLVGDPTELWWNLRFAWVTSPQKDMSTNASILSLAKNPFQIDTFYFVFVVVTSIFLRTGKPLKYSLLSTIRKRAPKPELKTCLWFSSKCCPTVRVAKVSVDYSKYWLIVQHRVHLILDTDN